jgi:hypothetical protein
VLKNLLDIAPVEALQNKPVGIVAMGGSPHHYLGVDWRLREVLTWFGALVAPTAVYLTGADFRDGRLASDTARADLAALTDTLTLLMRRLDPAALGPRPLAAIYLTAEPGAAHDPPPPAEQRRQPLPGSVQTRSEDPGRRPRPPS